MAKTSLLYKINDTALIHAEPSDYIGRIVGITPDEIVLDEACVVYRYTGDREDSLIDGKLTEVKKIPGYAAVNRRHVYVVYMWPHALPNGKG